MKSIYSTITIALVSSLSITLSSCGYKKQEDSTKSKAQPQQEAKTHDSVSQNLIANLEEMADALAKIKDIESAKSTLPTLTKIGYKMKMIHTDIEKLGPPTKEMDAKLEEKYGSKVRKIMVNINHTMETLKSSNPEAFGLVDKVMTTIMK